MKEPVQISEKLNDIQLNAKVVLHEVPEAMIEAIRAKYPEKVAKNELRRLEIPMNDLGTEKLEVVACVPDRNTVTQFMRFVDSQPKKAQEMLVNQCLLTNLEEVMADDYLFFTCAGLIAELFPIRQGRVKNF